jgi:hypothetical protein
MKPLTTRQRSTSVLILAIVFILVAPIILLYSIGYRLDDELSLQKTGGIFIHSDVANSSVFLDEKYLKDSGIFVRNTLIQDLTPNKEYKVEVHKEGYQSWIKTLFVYPSIVSEGRVLLLPNNFDKREIYKYLDENKIATSTPPSKIQIKPTNPEYISIASLFASSTKATSTKAVVATSTVATNTPSEQKSDLQIFFEGLSVADFEKLPNLIVDGKEVSWLMKGNINLYWIDDLTSIPYYYCGGEERLCIKNITLDWKDDITRFEYLPGRNDVWIALTQNGVYAVEVDGRTERNIQKIYEGKKLDFRLTQNDRLIIKEDTQFFEINL